jgi:hypothetical protein
MAERSWHDDAVPVERLDPYRGESILEKKIQFIRIAQMQRKDQGR